MINYMGLGEDGRIGFAVDKSKTSYPLCTKVLYFFIGAFFLFCPCTRGPTAAEHIEYVRTMELDTDEENKAEDNYLNKEKTLSESGKSADVLFTSQKRDSTWPHLSNNPVSIFAPNIPSFGGGQGNAWKGSKSIGLNNPYKTRADEESFQVLEERRERLSS